MLGSMASMREFHFERELFFVENRTRRNDQGLDREGPDADPAMDLHSPAEHDAKIMPRLSSKRRIRMDTRWERSDQEVQDDRLGATTMLRLLHVLYGPRARSGAGKPSGLLSGPDPHRGQEIHFRSVLGSGQGCTTRWGKPAIPGATLSSKFT